MRKLSVALILMMMVALLGFNTPRIKADENQVYWAKTYGGSDDDRAYSVAIAPNGDIIVAGYTYSFGAGDDDFWVLRLDENGNLKWQKTYGGSDNDYAEAVAIAPNGDIIVAGDYLLRLGPDGELKWAKYLVGNALQVLPDGTAVLAGSYSWDLFTVKFNVDGVPDYSGWRWNDVSLEVQDTNAEVQDTNAEVKTSNAEIRNTNAQVQDTNAKVKTLWTYVPKGTPKVTSSPSGAKVYVNGSYWGETPLTLKLSPGSYEVKLTKDDYEDYTTTVTINAGETKSISADLKPAYGYLSVESSPSGASVYVDGEYIGTTPITDYKLSPGEHTVKIKKNGYKEFEKSVNIEAGKSLSVSATLVEISTVQESTPAYTQTEQPSPTEAGRTSGGIKPAYLIAALIGLVIIGGAVRVRGGKRGEKPKAEERPKPVQKTKTEPEKPAPRYEALGSYLSKLDRSEVKLKFEEIEGIINARLPDSARKHRAWWGNDKSHPHAVKGWLNAGWKVKKVDLNNRVVEFERMEKPKPAPKKEPRPSQVETKKPASKPEEQPLPEVRKPPVPGFPSPLLERYEPLEFLGEGGFAKVFKVKRKKDGKIVALKIPRIDEKTSKTFIKEVSTWLHLNHENIVKLHDVDILPVPYLEMEFVEGVMVDGRVIRDLDAYPKPVDEEKALKLVRGIAKGLAHAHSKGIYHRDLKPLNVLLKSDLTPKITDWGLAKLGTMSSSRSVLGYTPLYASPEHLMPSKYGHTDQRTDIWQLGVTFYELLTGKLPFEGYTYEEVFGKIVDKGYRFAPPSKINPALAKYDGIFEKLLAKRKEDRYGSVEEFLRDLERVEEVEKKKAELEKEVEELKKSLAKSVEALKESKTAEEALRNRRLVVETLGKLALAYAELNRKAELLNTLNDLKFYTVQNLTELTNAINTVELLIKENLPVSDDLIERVKVLVHSIKRENGA